MKSAALLLLIAASSTGYAGAAELDAQGLEKALSNAATTLAARTDADSLAAAALFTQVSDAARAEQLAARASAAEPKRPDLLWLHTQLCYDVQACDRVAIDAKLHALDPDNGAVFIHRLQDLKGGKAGDQVLAAAAATKKVDFYWTRLIAHLAPAVISTRALPPSQSVVAVIGAASAIVIPPLKGAGVPCRDWVPNEEQRAACKAIARSLLQGDTVLAQVAGTNLTERLWPADSREALAAQETRRTLMYQIFTNGAQGPQRLIADGGVDRYLDKLGRYRREQDVIVAELIEAGSKPTPPAGWTPVPPRDGAFAAPAPPAIR
jgi:hypothetical protein